MPSVSRGCVPQSGSSVCLHLLPAPPWAPTDRPGGSGHLLAGLTSGHCLGPSRGLAPGSHPSHKAPGAWGGAAAHLAESRTPGQGVVPDSKPLIPALGRRVPRAGQAAQVFPAHLQITPRPNRHPRDRWRRRRASHGAWPRVDWLLGSARGRDRVVSP